VAVHSRISTGRQPGGRTYQGAADGRIQSHNQTEGQTETIVFGRWLLIMVVRSSKATAED